MIRRMTLIGLGALVSACSAEVKVSEIKPDDPPGTTVNGVPFRVKERYIVNVYQKGKNGYTPISVENPLHTLPNPNRIYVLEHLGQLLSDSNTKFTLNDDGTLSTVQLGAESQLDEAVAALEQGASDAGKVLEDIRAREAQEESQREAEEDLDIAYQEALNSAKQAIAELGEVGDNAKPSEIVDKENAVALAKLKANIAARRAGLPRPYPDFTL